MTISYNGSYSLSSPTQPIEFLDNYVVAELSDRAAVYNNGMPTFMKVDANGNLYWPEGVLDAVKNGTFNDVTRETRTGIACYSTNLLLCSRITFR